MRQQGKITFTIVILGLTLNFAPALWLGDLFKLQVKPAFAQEETPDPETETPPPEEEEQPEQKVALPGPVPGISPETFRMIEMIEKKNRDLKKKGNRDHAKGATAKNSGTKYPERPEEN